MDINHNSSKNNNYVTCYEKIFDLAEVHSLKKVFKKVKFITAKNFVQLTSLCPLTLMTNSIVVVNIEKKSC